MAPLLLHGDCLELMKTLPDKSIDLFLCDLPYGCLADNRKKQPNIRRADNGKPLPRMNERITGCGWDIKIDLAQFWEQVQRLMKNDHTPILHFCNVRFGYELINSKPDWFRYDLVWNKMCGVSFLSANKMPMRSHENIYVFAKKGATYYRKDITGDFLGTSGGTGYVGGSVYGCAEETRKEAIKREGTREGVRCVKSVVTIANKKGRGNHPTQKPDDLYEWLIERYSKEGDTVLDPTAGSFTSVFTAEKLGRHGIGIEKDEAFYAKAKNVASS